MSDIARTKTTWETSRDAVPDSFTQITVYDENTGQRVATVFDEQHAELIRSAPELLEELERLASSFETCLSSPPSGRAVAQEITSINLRSTRAAIAKARGLDH